MELQCLYCEETFPVEKGMCCMKTTPYYPYTNCELTLQQLKEIAREYDVGKRPEDKIKALINYDDPDTDRLDICSALGTKFRPDAPAEKHFFCSAIDTNQCFSRFVNSFVTEKVRFSTWDGKIPCCANQLKGRNALACESYYDTADTLEHINRSTRVKFQRALDQFAIRGLQQAGGDEKKDEVNYELQKAYDTMVQMVVPECPNCTSKFIDWTNCYAIECSGCKKHFCGVCLSYFGTDHEVHVHIRTDCKKHEEWRPVNPECDYYGNNPRETPLLFIRVQTNQAPWVAERRARYPNDEHLQALTLIEKVVHFVASLSMDLRFPLMDRIWRETVSFKGTRKVFVVNEYIRNRRGEIQGLAEIPVARLRSTVEQVTPHRFFQVESFTELFSDSFFPLTMFLFMNPIFFYPLVFPFAGNQRDPVRTMMTSLIRSERFVTQLPLPRGYTANQYASELLSQLLFHHKAVVAGGFVLNAMTARVVDFKQDMDVYVHHSQAFALYQSLLDLGYNISTSHITPTYDESFIRKNRIEARFRLDGSGMIGRIDVMVIPDAIPLQQVVTNFDLTFCQVWYDGKRVHSSHPDDIARKHGSLQPQYHAAYQSGNLFLHRRIEKYQARGFRIDTPPVSPQAARLLDARQQLNAAHFQRWLQVKTLIERLDEIQAGEVEEFEINTPLFYREVDRLQREIEQFDTDPVYKDAHSRIMTALKANNPKSIQALGPEAWVVTKMYEALLTILDPRQRLVFILNHPLEPRTETRLREILRVRPVLNPRNVPVNISTLFRKTFMDGYALIPHFLIHPEIEDAIRRMKEVMDPDVDGFHDSDIEVLSDSDEEYEDEDEEPLAPIRLPFVAMEAVPEMPQLLMPEDDDDLALLPPPPPLARRLQDAAPAPIDELEEGEIPRGEGRRMSRKRQHASGKKLHKKKAQQKSKTRHGRKRVSKRK